jgi:hypothetical protein
MPAPRLHEEGTKRLELLDDQFTALAIPRAEQPYLDDAVAALRVIPVRRKSSVIAGNLHDSNAKSSNSLAVERISPMWSPSS